jgi:hypothetical protein
VGAGYLLLDICFSGPVLIGSPSISHRGRPPSSTLDFSWPKERNINNARGDEKMPWESYLINFCFKYSLATKHSPYNTTWDVGMIPNVSKRAVNFLLYDHFSNRRTKSITEHLWAWHHVFKSKLVGGGNLIKVKIACTWNMSFYEFF